ncbi:MAG: DinB family protein [Actinomycetota bacterium]
MDQPPPDTKNWTWVLEQQCPECGYEAYAAERNELGARIRANAADWRRLLSRGDLVYQRPPVAPGQPPAWSALEYGAHTRDVVQLFHDRLKLALSKKNPTFSDWDQDRAAIDGNYAEQDPNQVAYQLAATAGRVADMVDRVNGSQWERTAKRSDGAEFTVETLIRYKLHDLVHHVWDVEQGYEALTATDEGEGGEE